MISYQNQYHTIKACSIIRYFHIWNKTLTYENLLFYHLIPSTTSTPANILTIYSYTNYSLQAIYVFSLMHISYILLNHYSLFIDSKSQPYTLLNSS